MGERADNPHESTRLPFSTSSTSTSSVMEVLEAQILSALPGS